MNATCSVVFASPEPLFVAAGGVVAVLLLVVLSAGLATPPQCRVSEFFCDTGQCVALDRYCDGADDCGDKSDEPRYCSRESLFSHSRDVTSLSACR